jgi:hypothetical protein
MSTHPLRFLRLTAHGAATVAYAPDLAPMTVIAVLSAWPEVIAGD